MPDSVSNGTFIAYLADDGDTKAITYTGTWAHLSVGWNESYLDTGTTGDIGSKAALTFEGEQYTVFALHIGADPSPKAR